MIMLVHKKNIILFIVIMFSIFSACTENHNKLQFSFEQIQNSYYKEIESVHAKLLCPFYISKKFFNEVEEQLNGLIAESDYCSVRICVNVDNGILHVAALYNLKNEVYFKIWKRNGGHKESKIQNSLAKRILKSKPKDLVLIEDSKHLVLDSTSTYIIKKIGRKTYYYAYYYMPCDDTYESLINLFREGTLNTDQ